MFTYLFTKYTLVVVSGIRSGRLELCAGNTETFVHSSAAGINPVSALPVSMDL